MAIETYTRTSLLAMILLSLTKIPSDAYTYLNVGSILPYFFFSLFIFKGNMGKYPEAFRRLIYLSLNVFSIFFILDYSIFSGISLEIVYVEEAVFVLFSPFTRAYLNSFFQHY
jgi:hypothetical protein